MLLDEKLCKSSVKAKHRRKTEGIVTEKGRFVENGGFLSMQVRNGLGGFFLPFPRIMQDGDGRGRIDYVMYYSTWQKNRS